MKKFLIIGYPRSGTKYIYRVMKHILGPKKIVMEYDDWSRHRKCSCVGWDMLEYMDKFDVVLHQTRDFFNVLKSIGTLTDDSLIKLSKLSESNGDLPEKFTPDFYNMISQSWVNFNNMVSEHEHALAYRVEDIDEHIVGDIFKIIDVDVKRKTIEASLNSRRNFRCTTNNRRSSSDYRDLSRDDFSNMMSYECNDIVKIVMDKYGY